MSEIQQVVKTFHSNIISFLDELIDMFPSEADLVIARLFLKDTIPPITTLNKFIQDVMPNKDKISERDATFFLEDADLLGSLNQSKVNHLNKIWKSSILDDEDRQIIWTWFDTFVYLAEKYQKLKLELEN
jgi:hypothetical protein